MSSSKTTETLCADVLIIGGGGAALKAAISARQAGAGVLIASKGPVGKSGATYHSALETGAYNVPGGYIDSADTPDIFYRDIMEAAKGCADPLLARIIADEAEEGMRFLEECGVRFERNADGSYM